MDLSQQPLIKKSWKGKIIIRNLRGNEKVLEEQECVCVCGQEREREGVRKGLNLFACKCLFGINSVLWRL